MSDPSIISPTKRIYNKWVANETLEDFALRFTAKRARRWSVSRIANTALGTASFLVLEALGGAITLAFGFENAFYAIAFVCSVLFLSGLPIAYYAARDGVDIDLLTRGAGFGYLGSTISSLIYASFTFIFFALEAAIMAMALHFLTGINLPVAYILSAIVILPLVTHGISRISLFQLWTQPLWVVLQILPLAYLLFFKADDVNNWLVFAGIGENLTGFDFLAFSAASAMLFPLIAQIGEQVDFLRFLPEKTPDKSLRWWSALIIAGPGWVLIGFLKLLAGSLLAYMALQHGISPAMAADPTHMYQVAFGFFIDSPAAALAIACIFVILCQLKINVANAYAGSLAWSNFFARLTQYHPGRVVWVFFNVSIALILMELGIYEALGNVLQTFSAFVLAWMGTLVADLIINKPLGLSPGKIEFRRGYLYDINPVGVGSMLLASILGIATHLQLFGQTQAGLAPFIALFLPFLTAPLLAWLTHSRFYLIRDDSDNTNSRSCGLCQNEFDQEDMLSCPAHQLPVCSLCCSLENQCDDLCRPQAPIQVQIKTLADSYAPALGKFKPRPSVANFFMVLLTSAGVMFALLGLLYMQTPYLNQEDQQLTAALLTRVFFLMLILLGIFSWLFVLSQQRRLNAIDEIKQQTGLLKQEIQAHEITYKDLQTAKDDAEAANMAKSRYLGGISHELRTPLNVILGYAQILENSREIPGQHKDSLNLIRQNGEHLADLIEGLLEMSKIEAGRLQLQKDEIRLPPLLDQIAEMFRLQANIKGLEFHYERSPYLPEYISIDLKRLRQMLINLLSNAVKYTRRGSVTFKVHYSHQIAHFIITDTGDGISELDQKRIFEPFERIVQQTKGIGGAGLGLAISRLLAELMGGDIQVESEIGKGSTFRLRLALHQIERSDSHGQSMYQSINDYAGKRKTLAVVDDEYNHRRLLKEFLSPLGFTVFTLSSAESCLALVGQEKQIDLFILDVSMPETDGWQLCRKLRERQCKQPIIMLSANTPTQQTDDYLACHQAYLNKPVQFDLLLDQIAEQLSLQWISKEEATEENIIQPTTAAFGMDKESREELIGLAEIGYLSAIKEKLSTLNKNSIIAQSLMDELELIVNRCDFPALITRLKAIENND